MTARLSQSTRYFYLFSVSVLLYVLFEWVFTITRISFLASAPITTQLRTLLIGCALLLFPGVILFSLLALLRRFGLGPLTIRIERFATVICIVACSVLFLDTIVYSLSRFGLRSLNGWLLLIPASLMLLLGYDLGVRLKPISCSIIMSRATVGIVIWSVLGSMFPFLLSSPHRAFNNQCADRAILPNIVILSSDGVSAERMSVYGYARETTPYLQSLSASSLIFENAFSNSRRTTSSISSMLSGRSALRTGVVYFPDFYTGEDAFRHLPGLLKACGYKTIDVSLRDIVDPFEINMRQAFDFANGRTRGIFDFIPPRFDHEKLFLLMVVEKFIDRALHLSGIHPQQHFYQDVLALSGERRSEESKLELVLEPLASRSAPVFAHIHLMGTHGRRFFPRMQEFSKGQEQSAQWMTDFYDDAVLDFDSYIREFMEGLRKQGTFDSTLLIVTSDHAINSGFGRVPLILHYPKSSLRGRIGENAQRLDIAPTVLDLLELPKPAWMEGQALLKPLPADRPMFFIDQVIEGETNTRWKNLKSLGVIVCDTLATIEVRSGKVRIGKVSGHTQPCGRTVESEELAALLDNELRNWR